MWPLYPYTTAINMTENNAQRHGFGRKKTMQRIFRGLVNPEILTGKIGGAVAVQPLVQWRPWRFCGDGCSVDLQLEKHRG